MHFCKLLIHDLNRSPCLRLIVEEVLGLWGPQNCIETDTSFFGLSLTGSCVIYSCKNGVKETLQIISHI